MLIHSASRAVARPARPPSPLRIIRNASAALRSLRQVVLLISSSRVAFDKWPSSTGTADPLTKYARSISRRLAHLPNTLNSTIDHQ